MAPQPRPRLTAAVYLLYFLTAILGQLFLKGIIVPTDAAATAANLQTHAHLYRLAFATNLIATALYIALTALFYDLFSPVNRTLARLATLFSLTGCAIQAFTYAFALAPFVLLSHAPTFAAFTPAQLDALTLMLLNLGAQAGAVSLVFFGLFCLSIGCLIYHSTFLPRALGILVALAGLGWLTLLFPPFAHQISPVPQVLGLLAELSLLLWLFIKGVDIPRWQNLTTNY